MQTNLQSVVECVVQTSVAFLLATFVVQPLVFHYELGMSVDTHTSMRMALIFTAVSLVRSYLLRRGFNFINHRGRV